MVPRIARGDDALPAAERRWDAWSLPCRTRKISPLIGRRTSLCRRPSRVEASRAEEQYLIALHSSSSLTNRSRKHCVALRRVRSLYDDGSADPSAVTRDYKLALEAEEVIPPLLTVYGGKVTTHRRLAEDALAQWHPICQKFGGPFGPPVHAPRRRYARSFADFVSELRRRLPGLPMRPCFTAWHDGTDRLQSRFLDRRASRRIGASTSASVLPSARSSTCANENGPGTADDVIWRRRSLDCISPFPHGRPREAYRSVTQAIVRWKQSTTSSPQYADLLARAHALQSTDIMSAIAHMLHGLASRISDGARDRRLTEGDNDAIRLAPIGDSALSRSSERARVHDTTRLELRR